MEQPGAGCNQMPRQHFIVKQFILPSFSIHSLHPAFNAPLISRSLEPIEFVEEVQNSATASFYRLRLAGSGRFLLESSIQPGVSQIARSLLSLRFSHCQRGIL